MTKNEFIHRCVIALAANPMYHTQSTLTPETDYIINAAGLLADNVERAFGFDEPPYAGPRFRNVKDGVAIPDDNPYIADIRKKIDDIIDNAW